MAQETLKSLIAVIMTLSLQEQEQVVSEIQGNINRQTGHDNTSEEMKSRLRQAYQDVQEGRVYTQEQANRMMEEFVKNRIQVAA